MVEYGYIPDGKVSKYVEYIWYNAGYRPAGSGERVLPSGASQIIINLEDKNFRHYKDRALTQEQIYDPVVLAGIRTGPVFLDSYSRISTMGAVLRPGAVTALFGIPAGEICNRVVSLSDITGSRFSGLIQQLAEASSPDEKCRLLDGFFASRLDFSFEMHPAAVFAEKQISGRYGIQPVSKIIEKTGYSRRWFSEIFRDTTGINPKMYARLCRFQQTLKQIRKADSPDWIDLTVSCGYFDQSHFINDFRYFAGISPGEYRRNQNGSLNHLPV